MLMFIIMVYDQCGLHIIRRLLNTHPAPGAAPIERKDAAEERRNDFVLFFPIFVSTFSIMQACGPFA